MDGGWEKQRDKGVERVVGNISGVGGGGGVGRRVTWMCKDNT